MTVISIKSHLRKVAMSDILDVAAESAESMRSCEDFSEMMRHAATAAVAIDLYIEMAGYESEIGPYGTEIMFAENVRLATKKLHGRIKQ